MSGILWRVLKPAVIERSGCGNSGHFIVIVVTQFAFNILCDSKDKTFKNEWTVVTKGP